MSAVLWCVLILWFVVADFLNQSMPETGSKLSSSALFILAPLILLICAIVATVNDISKKNEKKSIEKEKREATYAPPAGSTAAQIRTSVATPQEIERRQQERHRQDIETYVNDIIESCKNESYNGQRKLVKSLGRNYKKARSFEVCAFMSEYDIDCPSEETKEICDELIKHGFNVSFIRREKEHCKYEERVASDKVETYYSVEDFMIVRW